MFKLVTAALFALVISVTSVQAGPSKRIFKGNYDGILQLENVVGDSLFYSPVRFNISATGKVTGTAFSDKTQTLLTVKGQISRVTVQFGVLYKGKMTGTLSDGTKWNATVEAYSGVDAKLIKGKGKKGVYTGSLTLTNL